ncbi:MAG: hypothetical protein DRI97_13150, partial [Bacteroidetes bacterium]
QDKYYGFFAPEGTVWQVNAGAREVTVTTLGGGKDFFSIALMTAMEDLDFFFKRAYQFVVDTQVFWEYRQNQSQVVSTYSAFTIEMEDHPGDVNNTLMWLYPHHWKNSPTKLNVRTFVSGRGLMKLVDGNSFTVVHRWHGLLPVFPYPTQPPFSKSKLQSYVDRLQQETIHAIFGNTDTYWWGKALGKWAKIIPIAEQVGDTTAQNYFIDQLQGALNDWFTYTPGESNKYFAYFNLNLGGFSGLLGFDTSFGSDHYNDQHFHLGYFIYAAGILAMYDPQWAAEYKDFVECVINQYACPFRNNEYFPFLRTMDVYEGHSWADGLAWEDWGNCQESSSEAMNGWTGIVLWGMATGNKTYRDMGMWGWTTEASAIRNYWFDVDEDIYPTSYRDNVSNMVTILYGLKGWYGTWGGYGPVYLHGINYIPVTPGSIYLGLDPIYADKDFSRIGAINLFGWHGIIYMYRALNQPDADLFSNVRSIDTSGDTWANTYHWIHSLASFGRIDTSVYADYPSYGVFNKNGVRTYVVKNYSDSQLIVNFKGTVSGSVIVPAYGYVVTQELLPSSVEDWSPSILTSKQYCLRQNYPNPFNSETTIQFQITSPEHVTLKIYNIRGQEVRTLLNQKLPAGNKTVFWDGTNNQGRAVNSGVYLYRLETKRDIFFMKKMILLR